MVKQLLYGKNRRTVWYHRGGQTTKEINKLDWVIVGGESGAKSKTRPMNPDWVQKIYEDCKSANVPFCFKQWGAHKPDYSYEFYELQEFPS